MTNAMLKIMKGVQIVPADNQSSEIGLDEIDLLDPNGFSQTDFEMSFPGLKGSAVYADSPLTDGRTLISGAIGNVTETIRCELTASSIQTLAYMMKRLADFVRDCHDFWQSFGQIEPIYLKHQVTGEPGPRFALIYDISVAAEEPITPGTPNRLLTLSIEREPYWRGIAPGDNPKHWYYIANGQAQQWNAGNANLLTGLDHRFTGSIENVTEQNSTASGYLNQNFIDIPATSVPGDAPALLELNISTVDTGVATSVLIGKSTKPISGNISRATGNNQLTVHSFNAADATVSTNTTLANDSGAPRGQSGTAQRSETTFGTASMTTRLRWFGNTQAPNGFSSAVLRGRYMTFVRARVSAASTTTNLQLAITKLSTKVATTPVTLTDQGAGGTGASTDWALVYLGVVTVPLDNRTYVSPDGLGTHIDQGETTDIFVDLQASRTAGAGNLYVCDVIFIPIDEGAIKLIGSAALTGSDTVQSSWTYDNTGYYTHGMPDPMAARTIHSNSSDTDLISDFMEFSGAPLYLTPKVNNRLIFLMYVDSTKRSYPFDPPTPLVKVNLIPRWVGMRDE